MDANKTYNTIKSETGDDLEMDRLFAAWQDDRASATPATLREWKARYPAQAAELAQWTAEAPVVACETEQTGPEIDRAEQRALTMGRDMIAARRAHYTVVPALADIYSVAAGRGLNVRALATRLGVGVAIVAKLQQRLIRYSTIPAALIDRLATELQVSAQQVRDYLQQPSSLSASASYKSSGVPQAAEPVDFAQAIRSCAEMSADQKAQWLSETQN
jgi:hypothetical protein